MTTYYATQQAYGPDANCPIDIGYYTLCQLSLMSMPAKMPGDHSTKASSICLLYGKHISYH